MSEEANGEDTSGSALSSATSRQRQRQPSSEGPNVELALSTSPGTAAAEMGDVLLKASAARKQPAMARRAGKSKLGAQKMTDPSLDFDQIASRAKQAEEQREREQEDRRRMEADSAKAAAMAREAASKEQAASKFVYQDIVAESKKIDERLKKIDPKKAQQLERLGTLPDERNGTFSTLPLIRVQY